MHPALEHVASVVHASGDQIDTTAIVTWNIQCGEGCDGVTDLERIARVVRAMGEADVVCLQEVSRFDPAIAAGADQAAELEALFPGFAGFFGAGFSKHNDSSSKRREFGNLVLSRLPVLQVFYHALPHPPGEGIKHMQRQATEAVVGTLAGPLRVMTTHLEYFSAAHRRAQIERLRVLQEEAIANEALPARPGASPYDAAPRPASLVLCGDLNLLPEDAEYRQLFQPPLLDAWSVCRKGAPHPHTTGLYDQEQWQTGPHCRDYFAVSPDLAARIVSVEMDAKTDASDHQPLRLVLA